VNFVLKWYFKLKHDEMYRYEVDCCNNGCGDHALHDVVTGDWS